MKKVIKGLVKGTLSPLGVGIMAADEIAFPPSLADGTMDAQKARERQDIINKLPKETRKKLKTFKQFQEEMMATGPTNNVGGGQIAGTVEAGDDPPVKKKKKKGKRYIYGGRGSRKMWMG